jgi:tetrahydromethanopterin S-methyltransferase subunit B
MEMLPLVKVVPEMNLTLDPTTGMIGAALGRDVVIISMDGVNQQLDELEVAVEDLYTALDPTTTSDGAYPGREGAYMMAGTLTNLVYGFVLGLVLLLALLL